MAKKTKRIATRPSAQELFDLLVEFVLDRRASEFAAARNKAALRSLVDESATMLTQMLGAPPMFAVLLFPEDLRSGAVSKLSSMMLGGFAADPAEDLVNYVKSLGNFDAAISEMLDALEAGWVTPENITQRLKPLVDDAAESLIEISADPDASVMYPEEVRETAVRRLLRVYMGQGGYEAMREDRPRREASVREARDYRKHRRPEYSRERGGFVETEQIFNYDDWAEFPYKIIYSTDGVTWEVVEGAYDRDEAERLRYETETAYPAGSLVEIDH